MLLDSSEFLEAFSRKDRKALELFFDRYWIRIFAFAYDITDNEGEAKDIACHAFAKLFQWDQTFPSLPNIVTFLYTIVRNDSLKYLDRRKRSRNREEIFVSRHISLEDDDDAIRNERIKGEFMGALYRAVHDLPEDISKVMVLRYIEGQSYKDIATTLDISLDQVKSRRKAGVRLLQKQFVAREMHLVAVLFLLYTLAVCLFKIGTHS